MLLRALDRLEEYLTAALLAAMTLLTFTQVVLRYVFDTGLIWALETTTYLFGWMVLIGISIGVRTNSHIAIDILTERLGPRLRRWLAFAAIAACLLYTALMLYASWTLIVQLRLFGSLAHDIPLPRWVLLASLPIGFALLALRIVQAAVGVIRGSGGSADRNGTAGAGSGTDGRNGTAGGGTDSGRGRGPGQ